MQIREIMTVGVAVTGNEQLGGETLERASDPTLPKTDEPAARAQSEAVPAQSIDPDGQAFLTAGLSEPPSVAHRRAPESGDNQPGAEPQPSEELLSEIRHVAQKVGGWKQLSEIAAALEVDGEVCGS